MCNSTIEEVHLKQHLDLTLPNCPHLVHMLKNIICVCSKGQVDRLFVTSVLRWATIEGLGQDFPMA